MLQRIVPQICFCLAIACALSQSAWAGKIHDLILNPKIGDDKIIAELIADNTAIDEVVRYPTTREKHWRRLSVEEQQFYDASVLEVAAKMERFGLVCWILERYPKLDIKSPLRMLGGVTLLDWARQRKAPQVERLLALRPNMAQVANPELEEEGHDRELQLLIDDESFVFMIAAIVFTTTFGSWSLINP